MNRIARKTAALALAAAAVLFAAPASAEDSGWTVATLPASDATMLQTAGTPLYAYRGASTAMTLGDVTFQAGADLSGANIAFDPAFTEANANAGGSSLLGSAWNFGVSQSMDEIRLTLSGLTSGHEYLVQILARNGWGNPYITIGDLPRVNIQSGNGSSGATVYGTIRAVGTSYDVVFKMGGSGAARFVAAVQVRDLGAAAPSVADPEGEVRRRRLVRVGRERDRARVVAVGEVRDIERGRRAGLVVERNDRRRVGQRIGDVV